MKQLIPRLRLAAVFGSGFGLTDAQLLECFVTQRDEAGGMIECCG